MKFELSQDRALMPFILLFGSFESLDMLSGIRSPFRNLSFPTFIDSPSFKELQILKILLLFKNFE